MTSGRATLTSAGVAGLVACLATLGQVGVAHAATKPAWEPDPSAVATISFYNASGAPITSGSVTASPMSAYAASSAVIHTGDTRAELVAAQPNPKAAATSAWNVDTLSGVTTDPIASGPAASKSASVPVVQGAPTDLSLADFIDEFPNTDTSGLGCAYETKVGDASSCTNSGYANIYQLRIVTLDTNGNRSQSYADADVEVTGATYSGGQITGGTWTEVYPIGSSTSPQGGKLKDTKKPTLSGKGKVGSTEKVAHGTWSPAASSYSYQWYLGSAKIKGATKASYKLISKDGGKKVLCAVTAKKSGYTSGSAKTKAITVKK